MFEDCDLKTSKVIFIDVDDTLADTRSAVYNLYVEMTGDKSGDIRVKSKRYVDFCPKWSEEEVSSLFKNGYTLYDRVQCVPGAKEAVNELIRRGYDVRIATIHVPSGIMAKQKWIEKHFPALANKVYYINSTDANKDIFREHALIDDDLKNIKNNRSCVPILLDVYNVYSDVSNVLKCLSWQQVLDKLQKI